MPFEELTTERLVLRRLSHDDAAGVYRYWSDPEVVRYQTWEPSGELVGDCGLHFPEGRDHEAEFGITLMPAHQGMGYASEALRAVLQYLFITLDKHRVYGSTDPRNLPSQRMMERVGMRREAHFRESLWFKGTWVDDIIYAMLRREWLERSRLENG